MYNLYNNLIDLLRILEGLDNNPDTWYYYNTLEKLLYELYDGLGIDAKYTEEVVMQTAQVIKRCNGDVQMCRDVVGRILSILHTVSE